jgi:mannitol-1-phosphate/altronate dehydrogenase
MQRLAFCAAAWMRYLRGMDEQGRVYQLNDPMADKLQALALAHAGDAPASVAALGSIQNIWGGSLAQHQAWHTEVTQQLERINRQGIFGALAGLAIPATALL